VIAVAAIHLLAPRLEPVRLSSASLMPPPRNVPI